MDEEMNGDTTPNIKAGNQFFSNVHLVQLMNWIQSDI